MSRKNHKTKHNKNKSLQSVQIIAGEHRHRKIDFIAVEDLRPTGARLRETLFNWLQPHMCGAHCLDLFAGSGILGFEALSRGAESVTFVEKNRQAAMQLQRNARVLKLDNARILHDSAYSALEKFEKLAKPFDIIFLDPPYNLRCLPALLDKIHPLSAQWIFIEDNEPFEDWVSERGDYTIHKSKKAGNIYYGVLGRVLKPAEIPSIK